MSRVTLCRVLPPRWSGLPPHRLGATPKGGGTPERYIIVERDDGTLLRLDLYAEAEACHAFEGAHVWGDLVAVGWGHRVYLIHLEAGTTSSIDLGSYFGQLHAGDSYLLATSAERMFRIAADGTVAWSSPVLAIDGVVISQVTDGIIEGAGEWDPPGGWRPFRLRMDSGESC